LSFFLLFRRPLLLFIAVDIPAGYCCICTLTSCLL
jgi:hypothetical protein